MNYPVQLLPKAGYKTIDCNITHLYLIRHVEPKDNEDIVDSSTGNIKLKYIADPTKHVADYSTSLLGVFKPEHVKIFLTQEGKKEYNHYCQTDMNVKIPVYQNDFLLNNERKFFTLKIANIYNIDFPLILNGTEEAAQCQVEHTPMKWNFWHFSIRWFNKHRAQYLHLQDDKLFDKKNKGWVRMLSTAARAMLVHHAVSIQPDYKTINTSCFQTKPQKLFSKYWYGFLKFCSITKK